VARQLDAALEVLHVVVDTPPDQDLWARLQRDLLESESLQVRASAGEPAQAILQAAEAPDVELLVLTTHGREIVPGRQLGRVAEAVVARAGRPVLLVRPEAVRLDVPARDVRRLLLPQDGTPTTAEALVPATHLASRLGASIDLLYVASPEQGPPLERGSIAAPSYVDQPQHEWPHWASEVIDRLCSCLAHCPKSVPVQMFLAQGDIGEEIARFATGHDEDVIVLVRRSRFEVGRARVLRAVLDRTPSPILLVMAEPAPSVAEASAPAEASRSEGAASAV
jgi:nucleotide-binding universal stress UspA family protein